MSVRHHATTLWVSILHSEKNMYMYKIDQGIDWELTNIVPEKSHLTDWKLFIDIVKAQEFIKFIEIYYFHIMIFPKL